MILLFVKAPPEYPFTLKSGEDQLLSLLQESCLKQQQKWEVQWVFFLFNLIFSVMRRYRTNVSYSVRE